MRFGQPFHVFNPKTRCIVGIDRWKQIQGRNLATVMCFSTNGYALLEYNNTTFKTKSVEYVVIVFKKEIQMVVSTNIMITISENEHISSQIEK